PFFGGRGKKERKKNNLTNFPSHTRALGQPPYETEVVPTFEHSVVRLRFKADAGSKVRLDIYRTKTVEPRKSHGVLAAFSHTSRREFNNSGFIVCAVMEAEDDEEVNDSNEKSRPEVWDGAGGGGDEGGGDEQLFQISRLQQHATSETSFNR
ncbi:hypothetical protein X777_16454, partial [Ooceraea biroi]